MGERYTTKGFVLEDLRDADSTGVSVVTLAEQAAAPRASVRRILGELRKEGYQIDVIDRRPSGNIVRLVL